MTLHNTDNGFCVLKVQARGKRDLLPVIGHAPAIGTGEWVVATGLWFTDRQHGLQFKAETLKVTSPTGAEGIEKYLASGYMRGFGPAMAKRIVAMSGEGTFEIIEAEPDRLKEVAGVGPTRATRIVSGCAEQKAVREIMLLLHAHGVDMARDVHSRKGFCGLCAQPSWLSRICRVACHVKLKQGARENLRAARQKQGQTCHEYRVGNYSRP